MGIYALDKRVPTSANLDRVATIMISFQQPSWNLSWREWSVLRSFAGLNHPTPTSKCPIMLLWELIIERNDISVWNWKHLKCIVLVPTRSKLYRRWRRIRILSEKQPAIQTRCHPAKLWKYPRFALPLTSGGRYAGYRMIYPDEFVEKIFPWDKQNVTIMARPWYRVHFFSLCKKCTT